MPRFDGHCPAATFPKTLVLNTNFLASMSGGEKNPLPRWVMNEEEIFHQALARRSEERAAYLDQACAGDAALRASVEALLRANVGASGFLEQPAAASAATVGEPPAAEAPGTLIGNYQLLEIG